MAGLVEVEEPLPEKSVIDRGTQQCLRRWGGEVPRAGVGVPRADPQEPPARTPWVRPTPLYCVSGRSLPTWQVGRATWGCARNSSKSPWRPDLESPPEKIFNHWLAAWEGGRPWEEETAQLLRTQQKQEPLLLPDRPCAAWSQCSAGSDQWETVNAFSVTETGPPHSEVRGAWRSSMGSPYCPCGL